MVGSKSIEKRFSIIHICFSSFSDYVTEHGASRNFEPWRQNEELTEEARKAREEQDADSMTALENKTLDNRRERDILDALDELKSLQARHADVDFEDLMKMNEKRAEEEERAENGLTSEEQAYMRKVFQDRQKAITRIEEEDDGKSLSGSLKRSEPDGERPTEDSAPKKRKRMFAAAVVVKKKGDGAGEDSDGG